MSSETSLEAKSSRLSLYCVVCDAGIPYHSNLRKNHKLCGNPDCRKEYRRTYINAYRQAKRDVNNQQGMHTVECAVCKQQLEYVSGKHLKRHDLTTEQYKLLYPQSKILAQGAILDRSRGSVSQSRYLSYLAQEPDHLLFEFITGVMLGDGSLEKKKGKLNARYAEGGNNELYLKWKYEFLKQYFPCTFKEALSSPHTKTGKQYQGWWIKTTVHPTLTDWYQHWYTSKKVVPFDLVEKYLTEFALAVWFCDDGHSGSSGCLLYTMAFSNEEVKFLSSLIKSRFGIENKILFNVKQQPFIRIPSKFKATFQEKISAFEIPGMEYKYRQL